MYKIRHEREYLGENKSLQVIILKRIDHLLYLFNPFMAHFAIQRPWGRMLER